MKAFHVNKTRDIANISGRSIRDDGTISLSNRYKLTLKKSSCKKCSKNFRNPKFFLPISPLLRVSNIIVKIIHNQTMEYLTKHKILYKCQWTFPEIYSADTCLPYLTDKILTNFNSVVFTGMVVIDIQMTFDTINHKTLLKKILSVSFLAQSISLL